MTVLENTLSKMQKLPTEQQQQVLRFIEFLAFELGDRQVNQESASQIAKKHTRFSSLFPQKMGRSC